jgi:hypothetical protein
VNLSPLYRWVYETVTEDSFVSIEKAERVLGYRAQILQQAGAYPQLPVVHRPLEDFQGQSGVSHRVPWKQGALAVAKWFF